METYCLKIWAMLIFSNQIYLIFGRYNPERPGKKMCLIYSNTSLGHSPTVTTNSDHQFPIISFFLSSWGPSLPTVTVRGWRLCLSSLAPSNGKWDTPSVTRSLPATGFLAFALGPSDTWRKLSVTHCQPLDRITMMGLFPLEWDAKLTVYGDDGPTVSRKVRLTWLAGRKTVLRKLG